jgi:hypothetical protein
MEEGRWKMDDGRCKMEEGRLNKKYKNSYRFIAQFK